MEPTRKPRKPPALAAVRTTFGRRLASRRVLHDWSQAELAGRVGVSQAHIGRWERGVLPRAVHLIRLAEVLGVSESWLLHGDASEHPAARAA